jgi:hypothetical protein
LVTFDEYGNSSLPIEIIGRVYGEFYASSLINKRILNMSIEQENGKDITVIEWGISEHSVHVELKYQNTKGEEIILKIPDNVKGAEFVYSTFYRPTELSIDIFRNQYKTMNFPD